MMLRESKRKLSPHMERDKRRAGEREGGILNY